MEVQTIAVFEDETSEVFGFGFGDGTQGDDVGVLREIVMEGGPVTPVGDFWDDLNSERYPLRCFGSTKDEAKRSDTDVLNNLQH